MKPQKSAITTLITLALILIITAFSFAPVLRNGFTNWDDQAYVAQNTDLQDSSFSGLFRVLSSFYNANYHPLTMGFYWLEYRLFGDNPFGYHLVSLILHLANSLLIFWLFRLISASNIIALVTMSLFALHPLHVETVAWVSDTKGLLCALFFLSSLVFYIYYRKKGRDVYYLISLAAFCFSLLSKSTGVSLPLVLLLIDYYDKRRIDKNSILEKLPFFLLSLLFSLLAIFTQDTFKAVMQLPAFYRFLTASYSLVFYLLKIILPVNLSSQYPYPRLVEINTPAFLFAPFIVAALLGLTFASVRYTRKVVFGVFFFLITLVPVLQIVPFGNSFAADRHTYLPLAGLFYLSGEAIRRVCSGSAQAAKIRRIFAPIIFIVIISIFALLSRQRTAVWKDSLTLWSDVLLKYPAYPIAYNNRATVYIEKGEYNKAIVDCTAAIEIAPGYAEPYFNRGIAYREKGESEKAASDLRIYLEKIKNRK